jgi:hypothetical protein
MRRNNIAYWASTGLFCAFLLLTSISYLTDPKFAGVFRHLGFPQYFRVELAVAKISGVLALLIPQIPARLKEWAYAGFVITLISGLIAHLQTGDPLSYMINVFFWLILLIASYTYWHKRNQAKADY